MTVLLDTHTLLWWLDNPEILSPDARAAMTDPTRSVYVSSISIVEIAIKQSLGKLHVGKPLAPAIAASHFSMLSLTYDHALAVQELPAIHKDPFDRMLVAQAKAEELTLVTADKMLVKYGIPILKA
ncbi:type II toxin-antitoxin system VapC family toxin [Fimbriiglobus ruber]|uniref:PIN domain-containing protein n=1 Tax=Fimbriiglobus ruber TaxID=1908690 RepID=A0A225E401_9BACT|nr:type II toxin-antitoxin system VapC family toxin [Fimbriiglobus ruber]OWK46484.1 hypothetical protein FRUB_00183 [Fimbriiglobus ruber]